MMHKYLIYTNKQTKKWKTNCAPLPILQKGQSVFIQLQTIPFDSTSLVLRGVPYVHANQKVNNAIYAAISCIITILANQQT